MLRTAFTVGLAASALAQTQNIVQVAQADPNLRALVDAVVAGGLVSALEGPGPFTVFAPINPAFDALGRNILDFVFNPHNVKALDDVLTYHVANGKVASNQITDGQQIPTLQGSDVTAHITGKQIKINSALVVKADVQASNGIIHVVDGVLVPSDFALPKNDILTTALAVPTLSTLVTAVKAANITELLAMPYGPYVVFAPSDDAFAKLPASTLQYLLSHPDALRAVLFYHLSDRRIYSEQIKNFDVVRMLDREDIVMLVNTTGVFVNGNAQVTTADVDCTNGVVHIIDNVLLPKAVLDMMEADKKVAAPTLNIVQLAQSVPTLSTLVKAVVAAGLVNTLESTGPFTVFAPTDDAFGRLPTGVLDYLLQNPDVLKTVLLYHTVAASVPSTALTNDEIVMTASGFNATVHLFKDRHHTLIFIDDAMVLVPDQAATNGLVHIIDNVILPPPTVMAKITAKAQQSRLRKSL